MEYGLAQSFASQTDVATLSASEVQTVPVAVLGGGFTFDLSGRTGLRFDFRALPGRNPARTYVSAAPSAAGTLGVQDLFGVNGGEVLQTSTVSGVPSTFGDPLTNVMTFDGRGVRVPVALTIGYYFRF